MQLDFLGKKFEIQDVDIIKNPMESEIHQYRPCNNVSGNDKRNAMVKEH